MRSEIDRLAHVVRDEKRCPVVLRPHLVRPALHARASRHQARRTVRRAKASACLYNGAQRRRALPHAAQVVPPDNAVRSHQDRIRRKAASPAGAPRRGTHAYTSRPSVVLSMMRRHGIEGASRCGMKARGRTAPSSATIEAHAASVGTPCAPVKTGKRGLSRSRRPGMETNSPRPDRQRDIRKDGGFVVAAGDAVEVQAWSAHLVPPFPRLVHGMARRSAMTVRPKSVEESGTALTSTAARTRSGRKLFLAFSM